MKSQRGKKTWFRDNFSHFQIFVIFSNRLSIDLRLLASLIPNSFFMDWFYCNLIILIKQCKIPLRKLDKALLFSRNQVLCLKIWKLWRAPTTLEFHDFCWNFAHVFHLPMSTIECSRFFLTCVDLELFAKIKKTWFLHTHFLYFY